MTEIERLRAAYDRIKDAPDIHDPRVLELRQAVEKVLERYER